MNAVRGRLVFPNIKWWPVIGLLNRLHLLLPRSSSWYHRVIELMNNIAIKGLIYHHLTGVITESWKQVGRQLFNQQS